MTNGRKTLLVFHSSFVIRHLSFAVSSERGRDGRAVADAVGTAGAVVDLALGRDAERMVDGRVEVRRRDGTVLDVGGAGVACAVDLPAADATPGEQGGLALAPVVAPAVAIDQRCSAELAGHSDQRLIEQAALL